VNSCIRPLHASVAMLALQASACFVWQPAKLPYLYPPIACVHCVTESADMYIAFVLQPAQHKLGMHCSTLRYVLASL
jgi:hypothetical protein